jgi:2-C-methyl-D-erythritol 4-phosphate cytidylyltransferase
VKTIAIIVAGGKGKRMGRPKQFLKIAGRPMLAWTLEAFQKAEIIDGIILVIAKEQMATARRLRFSKILKVIAGGRERQDSVKNGLAALPEDCEIVAIHDGARPAVTEEIITRAVVAAREYGAVVIGVPVKDTIKRIESRKPRLPAGRLKVENRIVETVKRDALWQAQTPQVFKKDIILQAYENDAVVTDDAMLVERLGIPVIMVMGSYLNLKVTTQEDLKIMEGLLTWKK